MTELIDFAISWHTVLPVLLTFGFAPGFLLRLLVKLYPPDDPRRAELIAELYHLPRFKRPMFVAEQIETVLFEGLPRRLSSAWNWTIPHNISMPYLELIAAEANESGEMIITQIKQRFVWAWKVHWWPSNAWWVPRGIPFFTRWLTCRRYRQFWGRTACWKEPSSHQWSPWTTTVANLVIRPQAADGNKEPFVLCVDSDTLAAALSQAIEKARLM